MLRDVILGLLRDGQQRHGYELVVQYRSRTGLSPGAGNFYRELQRLLVERLVEVGINPPGADPRRRPYRILKRGTLAFDRWLTSGRRHDRDLWERLLFLDRMPSQARDRLLRIQEDTLVAELKVVQLDAQSDSQGTSPFCDVAPLLRVRRLRLIESELAFVRDARTAVTIWERRSDAAAGPNPEP